MNDFSGWGNIVDIIIIASIISFILSQTLAPLFASIFVGLKKNLTILNPILILIGI